MMVLLDDDERNLQREFMFGPPPLGPGRLHWIGYSRSAGNECDSLSAIGPSSPTPIATRRRAMAPVYVVLRSHVRMLLGEAGTSGDLDAQADALLALLDPDYISHRMDRAGVTLEGLAAAWEGLAHKLCGR